MKKHRLGGISSAYGQLVLLVFLPISILASVGAVLVFFETTRAIKSEQDVLAQSALIRYETLVRPLMPTLKSEDYIALQERINEMGVNGMTDALHPSETAMSFGRRYMADQMHRMQSEQHVRRVAVLDTDGTPILAVGYNKDAPWGRFDTTSDSVWRLPTSVGTAYGMPVYATIAGTQKKFWLMVDMDNEPLIISYYRILLSLVITGLITILLLLLVLNLYSKRWITPIYELRLFLQKTEVETLGRSFFVHSDGEFYLLQKDLNATFWRLNESFAELKRYGQETEADLQQAFDEMEMQNISIRKARDMALEASASKSAFLANVSHELRTPLNAIDGFINLLSRSQNLDSKQALYVHTIKKSSAHLLALISDVLDFSKIEAGKLALDAQEFDLPDVVYEVADMLSPIAYEKGLRMAVQIYQDVPTKMTGDRMRVKQILTNLLGNAIKFTDTGGVVVKVAFDESNEHFIKISVIDTGKGVDKELEGVLFESFMQGDLSVTRRYGGTGLGLVISRQLTNMMGGTIGFFDNSRQGVDKSGATFWFCLPCVGDELMIEECTLPKLNVLAWIAHVPSQEVLALGLFSQNIRLTQVGSLAQLLEHLTKDDGYDLVIADGFGQEGDVMALLRQIRLHYKGQLFVFGYEIGLDETVLDSYGATALHEPLNRRKLHSLLIDQDTKPQSLGITWRGKRALIVDDHASNLLVLEALLDELGMDVVKADSGFVAIDVMTRFYENYAKAGDRDGDCIDIVFMDISMPVMSGIATTTAIRKLESTHAVPAVPVIALSAHGQWDKMDELYKAGINSYATKPIAYAELVNLLQRWLGGDDEYVSDGVPMRQTKPTTIEVVDWQDALNRSQGKPKIAFELLTMMKASATDEKQALSEAWASGSVSRLSDVVHRIIGATRYAGVPELRQSAEALYEQCVLWREKAVDFELFESAFLAVMDALDRVAQVDLNEFGVKLYTL